MDKILNYLNTVNWSFIDDGWQEDYNDGIKASNYEIEAFEEVLNYFHQKRYETNFIIKCLNELKELNFEIDFEENTDSFGEVIDIYYSGDSEVAKFLSSDYYSDKEEFYKKWDKALKTLEKNIQRKTKESGGEDEN